MIWGREMHKAFVALLIVLSINFADATDYVGVQLTPEGDTPAIAGLVVSGQRFDVSFDGSFGVTDVSLLGIDPQEAFFSLLDAMQVGSFGYTRGALLTPTNGPTGKNGQRVQVQYDLNQAYTGEYNAGWTNEGLQGIDPLYLAYFRVYIPNALKNLYDFGAIDPVVPNVPEPGEYVLLLIGVGIISIATKRKN